MSLDLASRGTVSKVTLVYSMNQCELDSGDYQSPAVPGKHGIIEVPPVLTEDLLRSSTLCVL